MTGTRRALITGCSSGIGRACAIELADRGYEVIATARDPRALDDLRAAQTLALDVTDDASVLAAMATIGDLDVVINNAGVTAWGPVELLPLDEIERVIKTNVIGVVRVCQAALPSMRRRRHGTIVNISTAALRGYPLIGAYAASKAALEIITEALRLELAPFGVRVLLAEPAGVESDFGRNRTNVDVAGTDYVDLQERALHSLQTMRRTAMSAEQVAIAVADLLDAKAPPLRNPIGDDAARIIGERLSVTDDAYEQVVLRGLGLDGAGTATS